MSKIMEHNDSIIQIAARRGLAMTLARTPASAFNPRGDVAEQAHSVIDLPRREMISWASSDLPTPSGKQ